MYYKCDKQEIVHDTVRNKDVLRIVHESDNAADISYAEYKDMLIKSVYLQNDGNINLILFDTYWDCLIARKPTFF